MAATITLNLEDRGAIEGLEDLVEEFKKAGKGAEDFESRAAALNRELSNRKAKEYAEDAKKFADEYDNLRGKMQQDIGASKFTAMATGISAAADAGRVLSDVFSAVGSKIKELSDQGVPAFVSLQAQIESTTSAWNNLLAAGVGGGGANSPAKAARDWGEALESVLNNLAGSTAEQRRATDGNKTAQQALDAVASAVAQRDQAAALAKVESLDEINQRIQNQKDLILELGRQGNLTDEQRTAHAQQLLNLENQKVAVIQKLQERQEWAAGLVKQRIEEEKQAHADYITDRINRVNAMYDQDRADFDKRKKEQEEQASREKRAAFEVEEHKRKEAEKTAEQEKRNHEEKIKRLSQQFSGGPKIGEAAAQEVDIVRKAQSDILKVREQATNSYMTGDVKGFFQARQEEFRILQEALQAQKQLKDKFQKEASPLEKIKGSFSDQDKFKQIVSNRQDDAAKKMAKDNPILMDWLKRQNKGEKLPDWMNREVEGFRGRSRKMDRDIERQANRDLKSGKIGSEEADKATNQLTNKTIDAAQKSGKLSEDTVAGLRQAQEALETNAQKTVELDEEVNSLSEAIKEVQQQLNDSVGSSRRRAQGK